VQEVPEVGMTALEPFTLEHFNVWSEGLVLDDGSFFVAEPFQAAFLDDLFAGTPESWLVVPEGNGKTTLISALCLYMVEHQPNAAIPVAASSRDQAEILYRQAEGFVVRTPWLHEPAENVVGLAKGKKQLEVPRFEAQEGFRRVRHHRGGRIQVFAADDRTGDGVIPTFCVLDELHRHRDLRLYRTWRGKLAKRHGQLVAISTAGEPGTEFEETRTKIRQAGDVERDGCFLRARASTLVLHEWAVPEDADVDDLELVKSANPFSGVTMELLRQKFESPTFNMGHWRRFVCNLATRSDMAAIQEKEWADAATAERIPAGTRVWAGLDVAWKWDTTALVPLWMKDERTRIFGEATVLVPPRDGTSLDPNLVEKALIELHARTPIETLVMDISKAEQLAVWAESELGCDVIERSQSNKFAADDYDKFMEALRSGWLFHQGDVEFTRHALNAVARILPLGDAKFERPSQSRNASEQDLRVIDALVAAAMAHAVAAAEFGMGEFVVDPQALLDEVSV
jgi:hypothetical protein